MAKGKILILTALVGVSAASAVRASTIIDFDDLINGEIVSTQYAPLGIVFRPNPTLDPFVDVIYTNASLALSDPNVLAASGANTDGVISWEFTLGASHVNFRALQVDQRAMVDYYDTDGYWLYGELRTVASSPSVNDPFAYTAPANRPIGFVMIKAMEDFFEDPFAIDNVEFEPIPEPASLSLLLVGIVCLMRRRR